MSTTSRRLASPVTRRSVLRLLAIGASGLLAACAGPSTPPAAAPKPTEAPKPAAPATQAQPAAPAAAAQPTQPAKPAADSKPAADAKPTAAQQAPAASKKLGGEIRLHMRTGSEEDTLKEVLPKFSEETGVQVKLENIPSAEYFSKLQTLIAGGTIGDVWWCAYRNTPRFALNKIIMPLEDLIKADKFDLSQYYQGALDATKYQGQMYALPFKYHPGASVLYYNVPQVQEAGITMPTRQVGSWDDLISIGKKLTKESGGRVERWGLYLPMTTAATNTLQAVTMYFRSWGGDVYSEDGKKALFNEQPAREAIRFMADLIHKHKIAAPGQELTANFEDLMIAEKVSMLQAHSSTKSITTKAKFEIRNLIFPPGPTGKLGLQAITDQIVINAKTQNPDAAWALAKLLCGKDVGVRLGGGTGGTASGTCGGRKDVFTDPQLMANPLHPIFVELVEKATAIRFPANLREEEVASAVHQTLMPIWLGERQPDDAFMTELNAAVQDVLDRPRA